VFLNKCIYFLSICLFYPKGAFKADLFRYCVLLIDGGVYADIDILLTSNLDKAIDDDVGFMLPIDYVS
jgi:mannosyltransferase OCH1-like enzyme